ncbi:MAG: bifunctional 5,10-methylenetetrahydrofolate dehydrogenase/5,10-methenyltetrahydrofolate cyclohydrolase [Patescibacteria group bacterium]|nr:bifunctional 5,10-methylenetetrahydrofolate dehydrogenase/5,10-methenyltetrahydrofolate cyclohydrolase [Patescibacteria group bacterium]MDE1966128.1 bifunctional 5,10-methylenetetrahydrofolate dehydrogenase/5,10-methenyltetrahydrofolate cyclohydrolase [Patescibacteria group bacterium]
MIVDGRALASEILADVARRAKALRRAPVVRALVIAPSPATESYLKIKKARAQEAGMTLEEVVLPDTATTEDAVAALRAPGADAVIAQLPLPEHIDTTAVLDAIPRAKDADVLSRAARAVFEAGEDGALMPPVAAAVMHVLAHAGVPVSGKRAAVIGAGWLVGGPVIISLRNAGALVTVVTKEEGSLEGALRDADIVVSGTGVAGLIRPELLKKGVALIDAGTAGLGAKVVGDALPACADVASVFTPVPGGVGPVAVACLYENAIELLERKPVA